MANERNEVAHTEERFTVEGRKVTLRRAGEGGPVVYLHVFQGDGLQIWQKCLELGCDDFSLASIETLNWNDDMSPWDCLPLFKNEGACHGKARAQLNRLLSRIKPHVEEIVGAPAYSAIVGYSLAGLFAAWAVFQTGAFTRMASVSGSMWFPGFVEYADSRDIPATFERAYFSLGDRESHTPNPVLSTVGDRTAYVVESFKEKGVETVFEWNRGNHFKAEALRTAKGIRWLLGGDGA